MFPLVDTSYIVPDLSVLPPGSFDPAIDIEQETDSNHDTALTLAAAGMEQCLNVTVFQKLRRKYKKIQQHFYWCACAVNLNDKQRIFLACLKNVFCEFLAP